MAMTEAIRGVATGQAVAGAARQTRGPSGFRVPQTRATAVGLAHGVEEVGLAGMLALQELPDPALADREARRRGQDILAALAALQRALLGPGGADAGELAALATAVPRPTTPRCGQWLRRLRCGRASKPPATAPRARVSRQAPYNRHDRTTITPWRRSIAPV